MASDLFNEAFAAARKAGKKEFDFAGKKYHTRTKEEDAAKKSLKDYKGGGNRVAPDYEGQADESKTSRPTEALMGRGKLRGPGLIDKLKGSASEEPKAEAPGPSLKDSDTKYSADSRRARAQAAQDKADYNQSVYAKGGSVRGVGAALRGYGKGKLT